MTIVRRPSPFGDLLSLRSAMDRLFEDSFVRPGRWIGALEANSGLPLDVRATPDAIVVEAALPGVKPDDVDITVDGGTLTISASTASEEETADGDYLVREIRRGSFSRAVVLPDGVEPDKATAGFQNGVLTLRIPKAEQLKPRQIRISPSASSPSDNGQTAGAGTTTADVGTHHGEATQG